MKTNEKCLYHIMFVPETHQSMQNTVVFSVESKTCFVATVNTRKNTNFFHEK